jgi:Ca2+-binding EF-hand superfamily protein
VAIILHSFLVSTHKVKKIGYQHIIVASFSHMTRLGDKFIEALHEAGEDFSNFYAFSEFIESIDKDRVPESEKLPVGLAKMEQLGIRHAIIEFDLVYKGINYEEFKVRKICKLLKERMDWCRSKLHEDSRVLFNIRDFSDAMRLKPKRVLKVVNFLSSLPENERPFAIIYEESGKNLPEELGVWTAAVRKEMNDCGWTEDSKKKGHLLVHVHEQWGLSHMTQMECIINGATGIWAGLCEEGASMGHASSTIMLMNMIRMGNKKVLDQYKGCVKLREAAQNVTQITTGLPPHPKQPVYGERALDMVFGMPNFAPDKKEFSMAEFFGEKPVMRMTTLASPQMVVDRLTNVFGENPAFTLEMGQAMLAKMLEDLRSGRKEEYMSKVGLAVLFDRSGGQLTSVMADTIAADKPKSVHVSELLDKIRKMWDEWDLRDDVKGDNKLEFDSFYNGFMAPYFGCYRCDETKRALKAIDMDEDGSVDWNEFALYLTWAAREYPNVKDAEELLSIAFRKGLIPAMQDVVLEQN